MAKNFYTYLYFDPSRNEPIYVGKGCGARATFHKYRNDRHPFTNRLKLMLREGVEPVISFLCTDVDEEFAYLVEIEAIAKYGRKDKGCGPLLNLTDGGEGNTRKGYKQSAEVVANRVAKNTGQKRTPEQRVRLGSWVRTEETRMKIRTRLEGKPQQTVACPHCSKVGGVMVMKRWHFDKCRSA